MSTLKLTTEKAIKCLRLNNTTIQSWTAHRLISCLLWTSSHHLQRTV